MDNHAPNQLPTAQDIRESQIALAVVRAEYHAQQMNLALQALRQSLVTPGDTPT